jgi:sugar O-acyltransferase (sialic acid O-acetyltransferase NeuD family)
MGSLDSPQPLLVLGSGNFSYSLIESIRDFGSSAYEFAGFVQNVDPSRKGESFEGFPIYTFDEIEPFASTHAAICFLGDSRPKRKLVEETAALGFRFATLIHPTARVGPRNRVGAGSYVAIQTVLTSPTVIGKHTSVMGQCMLGENCTVGDFVYIGPGTHIAGRVTIGSGSFIGIGVVVSDGVSIGENAVVGAGAVVVRDVPDAVTVVGNPARPIESKGLFRHRGRRK